MSTQVFGVDLHRIVQVSHGECAARVDLALRAENERLRIKGLDHHRGGRLGAWLHAKDNAAFWKHFTDGDTLFIEDRHGP